MSILAVVPVKHLDQCKSRLASVLDGRQRQLLVTFLLVRIVKLLKRADCIDDIILVSRDRRVKRLAASEGILFFAEKGHSLNGALDQATRWAIDRSYNSIIILPIDLPLLSMEDLIAMVKYQGHEGLVVAPDHELNGTNALLLSPPGILHYRFGPGSFSLHCRQAREKNIPVKIYRSFRAGFDLDLPEHFFSLLSGMNSKECL